MKHISSINNIIKKILKTGYVQVFLINFFIAMISFIGLLIKGDGTFTLANDFNDSRYRFICWPIIL